MNVYTTTEIFSQVKKVCYSLQLSRRHNWRGPKLYDQHQLVTLLILKAKYNLSLRRFVAWLNETKWPEAIGLREIPSYSTVYRAFQRIGLSVLRQINDTIVQVLKSTQKAIDGTGINMSCRSRHYEKRAKLDYLPNGKLDILADVEHYVIIDWQFTVRERHDAFVARRILRRAKKVENNFLWADKGYDSEKLHELAFNKGYILLAPVRRSTRKRPKGHFRQRVTELLAQQPLNQRPKIETTISILKRVYGETIRARLSGMKKKEMAWKIIAMNIDQVRKNIIFLFYLLTIRNRAFL